MRLDVQQVTAGYGSKAIVHEADLTFSTGQVTCLLGPNGCGKTTLFKTILRLLAPISGSILVDGEDIGSWTQTRMARAFGYVPQAHVPPFAFLVRDVVLMARASHLPAFAAPGRHDQRVASDALARMNILELAGVPYTQLSGGERQLVLISRALAQEPRWLVLDEPTANLDLSNQRIVLRAIRELSRSGLGILMTTHSPDHAFFCASQIALMKDGRIVVSGRTDSVLTEPNLIAAYGVPLRIVAVSANPHTRVVVPVL